MPYGDKCPEQNVVADRGVMTLAILNTNLEYQSSMRKRSPWPPSAQAREFRGARVAPVL